MREITQNSTRSLKNNLNPLVVLAFCKTFGFDIDEIYRKKSFNGPSPSIQDNMAAVNPELPYGFQGRFYGYFFNSTPDYTQQGKLDQFILDIGGGRITMTLRHYALDHARRYKPREIEMKERIIHNREGNFPAGFLRLRSTPPTISISALWCITSLICTARSISARARC